MWETVESKLLTLYSDVTAMPVNWLWQPYIAIGKITLLQGDPGCGKSSMMMNLIAELSKGGSAPDGRASISVPRMERRIRSSQGCWPQELIAVTSLLLMKRSTAA